MRRMTLVVALAAAAAAGVFAQASPAVAPRAYLTFGFQPLGAFIYSYEWDGVVYPTTDPMINSSFIFEYRIDDGVGLGAYLEIRGYKWSTITSADPLIGQIYGAPGITAGVLGFWHLLPANLQFDLCLSGGVGAKLYIDDEGVFPGLDFSSVLDFLYKITPGMAAGIRGGLSYSMHPERPLISDPSTTRIAFDLTEYNLGVIFRIGF